MAEDTTFLNRTLKNRPKSTSDKSISGKISQQFGTAAEYQDALAKNLTRMQQGKIDPRTQQYNDIVLRQELEANKKMFDVAKGARFGETVLGEEGLGRLQSQGEVQDVLSRMNKLSRTGMSDAESLAQREKALSGINQATAGAEQQLLARLGSRGVRGAVAGTQLAGVQMEGLRQKAEMQRDLYLQDEQIKRGALQDYASAVGQVKTFDLGQAAREKDIVLSSGLGFAGMGVAETAAKAQAEAARAAAASQAAAACFIGSEEIKMADGTYKRISKVDLGDMTSQGEVLGKSQHLIPAINMVCYNGIYVSKEHPVCYNGIWSMVGEVEVSEHVGEELQNDGVCVHVFNLWTSNKRLEVKGQDGNDALFTDWEGADFVVTNEMICKELNRENKFYDRSVVSISEGKIRSRLFKSV